jgi:hypothetical protein
MTMADVRAAQPEWFSRKNKRFFGDVSYRILHAHGKAFLVRSTYAWTDMLGGSRRLHWRVNELDSNMVIRKLLDKSFADLDDVKSYLKHEAV